MWHKVEELARQNPQVMMSLGMGWTGERALGFQMPAALACKEQNLSLDSSSQKVLTSHGAPVAA